MTSSYRAAQRAEDLINRLIDQGWSTHEIAAEMRRRGAYKRTAAADPTADFCASVQDMVADFAKAIGQPSAEESTLRTRAESAEQRAEAAEIALAQAHADRTLLAGLWLATVPPDVLPTLLPADPGDRDRLVAALDAVDLQSGTASHTAAVRAVIGRIVAAAGGAR